MLPCRPTIESRLAAATALFLLAGPVVSAGIAAPQVEELRPLRLADYYELVRIGDVEISPDGQRLVYTRTDIDREGDHPLPP